MTDRIDPRPNARPTPGQESAALAALADLAERGGLLHNRTTGWTAVPLIAGTEDETRRAIVAGMSYLEAYRGTDRDTGLRVWRGRVLGWQLAVSQYDPRWPAGPAAAAEQDAEADDLYAGVLADEDRLRAEQDAEADDLYAGVLADEDRQRAEPEPDMPTSWAAYGLARVLAEVPAQRSYAPAPLVDLAAVRDARRAVDQAAEVTA